jgi:hypothetical protein
MDVRHWAERLYGDGPKSTRLRLLLDELDDGYRLGDEIIQDALAVMFVEAFGYDSPVLPILGAQLRPVAHEMFPQSPRW